MIQELFRLGPLSISPFGVLVATGFLVAWVQLRWGLKRLGAGGEEEASALLLAAGVAGIAGGKVYYALLYGDWRLLIDRSGLVWYGGFLAGTAAVLWAARRLRLPMWKVAAAAGPTVAIGYAIGRLGCFLVGDDYGYPTRLPWGVAFPNGLPGPTTAAFLRRQYGLDIPMEIPGDELLAVHPTQLYETLLCLAIWALGVVLIRRGADSAATALLVFGLLTLERFAVEFLRIKDDRFFGPLTLAQAISLAVLVAIAGLWLRRRAADREAGASTAAPSAG